MKKYYLVDNKKFDEEGFYDKLNDVLEDFVDRNYDKILDERYGKINIAGCDFDASRILRELDPILYNVHISDIKNEYYEEEKYFIEKDKKRYVAGFIFEIIEE